MFIRIQYMSYPTYSQDRQRPNQGARADAIINSTGSTPAEVLFALNYHNHLHAQHSAYPLAGARK
jgi:hypothetical protein